MNYMKIILSVLFTISYYYANSQCLVTQAEYQVIMEELEEADPIVGLWRLSGETKLYESDSLILHNQDPFLDYWFIIPNEGKYKVCHTDYTSVQDFNATFTTLNDSIYQYHVKYGSKGEAFAEAMMLDSTYLKEGIEKLITYQLHPPIEKARAMGAKEGQTIEWTFYWLPTDEIEFFKPDLEGQEIIYAEMDSLYSDKSWTDSKLEELMKTSKNEFTSHIRERINSDSLFDITGCKDFPDDIATDKFIVISVNELFPSRISYFILFDKHDTNVWRVDFEIDENKEPKEILSFNKSQFHNKKTIALFKKINTIDGYDFWR